MSIFEFNIEEKFGTLRTDSSLPKITYTSDWNWSTDKTVPKTNRWGQPANASSNPNYGKESKETPKPPGVDTSTAWGRSPSQPTDISGGFNGSNTNETYNRPSGVDISGGFNGSNTNETYNKPPNIIKTDGWGRNDGAINDLEPPMTSAGAFIETTNPYEISDATVVEQYDPNSTGTNEATDLGYGAGIPIVKQEQVAKTISDGLDERLFSLINIVAAEFLGGQAGSILGALGGIIDLVVGVLDMFGLTDDLIGGLTSFFGNGPLGAGFMAVLGALGLAGRVKKDFKKAADRSSKYPKDANERIMAVQEAATAVVAQGTGHEYKQVAGTLNVVSARSVNFSSVQSITESPMIKLASQITLINNRTTELVAEFLNINCNHSNYTVDDLFNINCNLLDLKVVEDLRLSAKKHINNAKEIEIVSKKATHLQGGALNELFDDLTEEAFNAVAGALDADLPQNLKLLTLSSPEVLSSYAGVVYGINTPGVLIIDAGITLLNCNISPALAALAFPRPLSELKPVGNPKEKESENGQNQVKFDNLNPRPGSGESPSNSNPMQAQLDSFNA